jgi:hypothetical protein
MELDTKLQTMRPPLPYRELADGALATWELVEWELLALDLAPLAGLRFAG